MLKKRQGPGESSWSGPWSPVLSHQAGWFAVRVMHGPENLKPKPLPSLETVPLPWARRRSGRFTALPAEQFATSC